MTSRDESILGRNLAVCLYTELEFVYERMWDLFIVSLFNSFQVPKAKNELAYFVSSESDMAVLKQPTT